jgi:hypothetical protein
MVGSTLGLYSVGLIFVSARTNKDIIIISFGFDCFWGHFLGHTRQAVE